MCLNDMYNVEYINLKVSVHIYIIWDLWSAEINLGGNDMLANNNDVHYLCLLFLDNSLLSILKF